MKQNLKVQSESQDRQLKLTEVLAEQIESIEETTQNVINKIAEK